ncbi:MAG: DUF1016 family protein [Nanoarchaeota archaeon]|nr:DUF1016 family protein [Nanoarchaeota archaeon]MBU4352603.1 DUF1016 family protein [Nanoarchaeota archaeon]
MKALTKNNYAALLKDIKSILEKGLCRAYKAVDNIKVQTYWQIGERIVREELTHKDRADYGKKIINNLAKDLGINRRLFYRIVKFYRQYPIVVTVSPQLSWSHYEVLIGMENDGTRKFYEIQSVIESWSVRELRKRITNDEYGKIKKTGQLLTKPPLQLSSSEEVFKESYNWDFISLEENHTEKQLENALLDNIQRVLLEFGKGFAFLARQQKILLNN